MQRQKPEYSLTFCFWIILCRCGQVRGRGTPAWRYYCWLLACSFRYVEVAAMNNSKTIKIQIQSPKFLGKKTVAVDYAN